MWRAQLRDADKNRLHVLARGGAIQHQERQGEISVVLALQGKGADAR